MKTTIKYAHGKGFSKNLSSVTVLTSPRVNREIQENIKKTRLLSSRLAKRSARNIPGGQAY